METSGRQLQTAVRDRHCGTAGRGRWTLTTGRCHSRAPPTHRARRTPRRVSAPTGSCAPPVWGPISRSYGLIAALEKTRSFDRRPALPGLGFSGFFPCDVVNEFPWLHVESSCNVQEREHTGAALPVLNVDEAAKAHSTALCEFFQAVAPLFPEPPDLHTEGQESGVW